MKGPKFFLEDRKTAALCAAATALVGLLCLIVFPVGAWLERLSFDLPCVFASEARMDNVVIVVRDEKAYKDLHQTYGTLWSRTNYVNLVNRLTKDGARLAVFDIFMPSKDSVNPAVDQQFADALRRNGRTILLMQFHQYDALNGVEPMYPDETLKDAALRLGAGVCFQDKADNVVRQLHPGLENYPSLAWAAAQAAGLPTNHWSIRQQQAIWINYPASLEGIRRLSFKDALDQPSGFYANKVVFIGGSPLTKMEGDQADAYLTPLSRWGEAQQPGVVIQAISFLNLMHRDWLQRFSPILELLLVLVQGIGCAVVLIQLRPWLAVLVAMALIAILYVAACLVMFHGHHWFPWMVVAGVQIPFATGWSAILHTRRLAREKELVASELVLERQAVERLLPPTESDAATIRSDVMEAADLSGGPPDFKAPSPEEAPTLKGPRRLPPSVPDHKLVRVIGEGAYGQVWLARDVIGTYHAVKFVFRNIFNSDAPYEREFKGIYHFTPISRQHAGFVNILHVGRNDAGGYFFYIMELGDDETTGQSINPDTYIARTLSRIIRRTGRLSPGDCVRLGMELSSALDFLHQRRLIHRDIKPSNVLFVNGQAKFADVGLVTQIETQRAEATYIGTEGYIAPEGPGTAGADVYSLGKVLYEATMGLDRMRFPDLPTAAVEQSSPLLMQLNAIILKACEFNARQRYQTARELYDDLNVLHAAALPKPSNP